MIRRRSKILLTLTLCWIATLIYLLMKEPHYTQEQNETGFSQEEMAVFKDVKNHNAFSNFIFGEMNVIEKKLALKAGTHKEWNQIFSPILQLLSGHIDNIEFAKSYPSTKDNERTERVAREVQSIDYSLRAVRLLIEEMWRLIKSDEVVKKHHLLSEDIRKRKNVILSEVELWRRSRAEKSTGVLDEMKATVREMIQRQQEPSNCTAAKKLLCGLGWKCGFACQLHHAAICFALAVGTGRTLILDSSHWAYSNSAWEFVFKPISSKSCVGNFDDAVLWATTVTAQDLEAVETVKVKALHWHKTPGYMPLRIPKQLSKKLIQHHGDPPAWWMGQLVSYLIRPQNWLTTEISDAARKVGFERPIAGIHVRRTDKIISEAASHDLSEYMELVIDWFDKESLKREITGEPQIQTRHVYIATDEPGIFQEAEVRYPDYHFIGDKDISITASIGGRYSLKGVVGLMTDVTLLSKCDIFVGTFSSGMSRLVYEMMQAHHTDPTSNVHSLDDRYYYIEQFDHLQRAVYDHVPQRPSEIALSVEDIIATRGNHWNGYSKGTNRNNGREGLYPSFKVEEMVETAGFRLFDLDEL